MILAAGGTLAVPDLRAAETGVEFFRHKTVTYIVSTAPGGGSDFYARLMAHHMERFLPESTFIVRNIPGAGHLIGLNFIYASKPDGRTIGNFTPGLIYSQIVGLKAMRADLGKMSWIGKQASDDRVVYMSSVSPFKTWADLLNAKRTIVFAASGVGSGAWTDAQIIINAWNLNGKVLPGYSGSEGVTAMLRGEVDGRVGGRGSQEAIHDIDPGHIVLQFSEKGQDVTRASAVATTPLQKKVVDLIRSQGELEALLAGPPGIPRDRLDALREAFRKAHMSPEYRAAAAKAKRPVDDEPVIGDEVAKLVSSAVEAGPELTALLKQITAIEPAMVRHKGKVIKLEDDNRTVFIMWQGKEVSAGISGSRTTVTVGGHKAKRDAIAVGLTCEFVYLRPGAEAKEINCE
jgi:tripartite-type tricarboxylate transporter receptor subunit TctC